MAVQRRYRVARTSRKGLVAEVPAIVPVRAGLTATIVEGAERSAAASAQQRPDGVGHPGDGNASRCARLLRNRTGSVRAGSRFLAPVPVCLFLAGVPLGLTQDQQADQHVLDAPVGEGEAVLYRSTAILTPVYNVGNTHDSREDQDASFIRTYIRDDPRIPLLGHVTLPGLDERRLGTLRAAISATDLTIPLTSISSLRVGESLEVGYNGNDHNGELMRIASVDAGSSAVTVVERFQARGASFAAPRSWPAGTTVFHHRRSRPERLPGYMVASGQRPSFNTFRMSWSGVDVPYLAMNLHFPGPDQELKEWEGLLIYLRVRRGDGAGRMIEGILPLAADAELSFGRRQPGNPYTVREQHLRRYLGWPENLDEDVNGATKVAVGDDDSRASRFIQGSQQTFLREIVDWIYADDGHDLGRIYRADERYAADELAVLEAGSSSASEQLVRSYQVLVDIAFLDGDDRRIDTERFSIRPSDRLRGQPDEADATLSGLGLSGIDIGLFATDTTAYAAVVGHDVTSTIVTATATHAAASVAISPGSNVILVEGANVIAVTVTAEDGTTTRTYTVTVTRAAAPLTASFASLPESHAGTGTVLLQVRFSEPVATSYVTLRDTAFQVTNGAVRSARRVDGRSDR